MTQEQESRMREDYKVVYPEMCEEMVEKRIADAKEAERTDSGSFLTYDWNTRSDYYSF